MLFFNDLSRTVTALAKGAETKPDGFSLARHGQIKRPLMLREAFEKKEAKKGENDKDEKSDKDADPSDKDTTDKEVDAKSFRTTDGQDQEPFEPQKKTLNGEKPEKIVTESFDSSYPWQWKTKTDDHLAATFKASDDVVQVTFDKIEDRKSKLETYDINFTRNGKLIMTGGGDSMAIMSTVLKIISSFIDQNKPPRLIFSSSKTKTMTSADESGRTKLYTALVKRFAGSKGYSFQVDTGSKYEDKFVLVDKTLTEETSMKTYRTLLAESSVGNTILDQIRRLDKNALMAWGYKDVVFGGRHVAFKIKTPKYPRNHMIQINLDVGSDTYEVVLMKSTTPSIDKKTGEFKGGVSVVSKKTDIYAENLVSTIDSMIENK